MIDTLYVFMGPLVAFIVWFLKFHIYQAMLHSYMISENIHLTPEMLAPSDRRQAFCIYDQSCDISPISAQSHPVLVCSLKALDKGVVLVMGGRRWCPFLQSMIPWRMANIKLGANLLHSPQLERNFKLVPCFVSFVTLKQVCTVFGRMSIVYVTCCQGL